MKRAKNYFDEGKVGVWSLTPDLNIKVTVKGTQDYRVVIKLDKSGNILNTKCDCPYEYGGLCKHITAVLLALEKRFEPVPDFRSNPESKPAPKPVPKPAEAPSSREIRSLIAEYKQSDNNEKKETVSPSEKIRLEPMLHFDTRKHKLELSLKIGSGKMYKVRDIERLYFDFLDGNYKSLAFTHRIDRLNGQSGRLLKIIGSAEPVSNYYYGKKDTVYVSGMYLDDLFELYRDNGVLIDEKSFSVKFEDPSITFSLKRDPDDRFELKTNCRLKLIGAGLRSYFIDEKAQTVFAADPQFTCAVCKLYETVHGSRTICISEKDMPEFYSAVLKKAADHVKINGLERISEFIPPELTAQLYIDCGDDNMVYADLMFCYNDNTYNGFTSQKDKPHYDEPGETAAKDAVLRYFEVNPKHDHRVLSITDDNAVYEFITNGITGLSETMELYVSDKFRRMAVRPPVKPRVGVRMSAGLLELDISDDNYSQEELAEILKAYKTGVKYRRLKDGSFAVIDDTLSQLGELAKNLDLGDNDFVKKRLKIPAYRMLYLDSLQEQKDIRMNFSTEFKKSVSEYRKSIEDPESLSVPEELSEIMRDYQKYGFRWLKTIAAYKFGGILADDMGLGKTIQAISLILDSKQRDKNRLPALIVCPSSLTLNWEAEIRHFAPQLKTLTVIGTAAARSALTEKISKRKYDAVITSYPLLVRDIDSYADLKFGLYFIDEAQYIKNHNTQAAKAVKAINSEVRFALTGTPIENSLAELWSAFDFIMPGYLFNYTRFKNTFESPITGKKDNAAIKALQSSTAPFILRRLKKDVLHELPDKTETVLTAEMEGEQRKLYAANVSALRKSVQSGLGSEKTDRVKILALLTRLRQICCDPSLVYENFKGKSAKLEQCSELVESCVNSGHKILLFSQFTSMLDIISKRLEKLNISYYTLQGSTRAKERIRLVNEFNANNVKMFLISLKAGGTGLNLTGADIVIHYDPWWNVSAENQASDRAYRIGQRKNVQVYKLITRNSIEEKIIELQQSKSKLGDLICGDGSEIADITKMSPDEILELLK